MSFKHNTVPEPGKDEKKSNHKSFRNPRHILRGSSKSKDTDFATHTRTKSEHSVAACSLGNDHSIVSFLQHFELESAENSNWDHTLGTVSEAALPNE
jgi:hypothetical protein